MQFPETRDLKILLESLLGIELPISTTEDKPSLDGAGTYGCLLIDDADNVVAALAADLSAATRLGGALSMKPLGALEDALSSGEIDDVVRDALSEVFNNITTTINKIEGNPHVRSKPAVPFSELASDAPWTAESANRTDFGGDYMKGGGRLVFVAP